MVQWTPIRLPEELYGEVTDTIKKNQRWVNEHDFIREAVREKLDKIKQTNSAEA